MTETIRENLTPDDVESKNFTPVRLKEGYDMAEVDFFLDEVVATLRKVAADNQGLRHDAVRNGPGLDLSRAPGADGGTAGATAADGHYASDQVPSQEAAESGRRAAQDGRMSTGEATSAAIRVLQMASDEAEKVRSEADAESAALLAEARRQSEDLAGHTRAEAARVEAESRVRADQLDEQTRARRAELFDALETERGRLAGDVEGLRAYEKEYRTRLRLWFTDQIGRLDAERSAATGLSGGNGVGPI